MKNTCSSGWEWVFAPLSFANIAFVTSIFSLRSTGPRASEYCGVTRLSSSRSNEILPIDPCSFRVLAVAPTGSSGRDQVELFELPQDLGLHQRHLVVGGIARERQVDVHVLPQLATLRED